MTKWICFLFLLSTLSLANEDPCTGGFPNANCDQMTLNDHTERESEEFGRAVEIKQLRERTNIALNAIVRLAIFKLKAKGYKKEANQLKKEWENKWDGYIVRNRDIGDHVPLSKWLAVTYLVIEYKLGKNLCHALRLDDLNVINFAIPVVFSCVDSVDEIEYGKHFVPFSGVVVYWGSFFTCVGFTWGSGVFYCGPLAMGSEWLTEKLIAPKLNHFAWQLSCGQENAI